MPLGPAPMSELEAQWQLGRECGHVTHAEISEAMPEPLSDDAIGRSLETLGNAGIRIHEAMLAHVSDGTLSR